MAGFVPMGDDDEAESGGSLSSSASLDAAKDVLAAIKAGDAKALDLALKRHSELSEDEESEPDEDDTEG
jgi:hypothetical protein